MNHPMLCTWLPGLPDFTPLDYILWRHIKDIYHYNHQAKEELKIGAVNYDGYV